MTRIAPKLQDTLDELVAVESHATMTAGESRVLPFHICHFFGKQSRCRGVALSTIAGRLRKLAELGLAERVSGTRPQEWRSTEAGREQAR